MDYNKIKNLIPNGITAIRLVLIPFFFYAYFSDLTWVAMAIFIGAVATDAADGYMARKLDSTSSWGAYFDVTADFIFILAVFSAFVLDGAYPSWLIFLFILIFLQFILTSKTKLVTYDPVGKHYGSFLFLIGFLTLITSLNFLNTLFLFLVIAFTIICIISRWFFFLVRWSK